MTVEALKHWHAEREEFPIPWDLIRRLMDHAFTTSVVPTRARANTLVLIPKPGLGQFCGIGLLEPIWKLISAVVNRWLMSSITFHDDLHRFLPNRGTGTACLEAKLETQLSIISGCPLHHVYLDFSKAYDSLDCDWTLLLLADYGVGPNMLRLLRNFWGRHTVIPRLQAVFGKPFPASWGLTTGDIMALVIFNIVSDAVLHRWDLDIAVQQVHTQG